MPYSKYTNEYFRNQYEADLADAKARAKVARARAGLPAHRGHRYVEVVNTYSDGMVEVETRRIHRPNTRELRYDEIRYADQEDAAVAAVVGGAIGIGIGLLLGGSNN